ncbi:MAG: hypothetical protein RR313_04165 [Anaerovoracaceae bacterium]
MKNKKNGAYKNYVIMIVVMIVVGLLYFATSGVFNITSTAKDVFSMSSSTVIAEGENWQMHMPDKDGLTEYLVYKGERHPGKQIHVTGIIYYAQDGNGVKMSKNIELYPLYDKHFFVGERRWYLVNNVTPEKIERVNLEITFKEYREGELFCDEVVSDTKNK